MTRFSNQMNSNWNKNTQFTLTGRNTVTRDSKTNRDERQRDNDDRK